MNIFYIPCVLHALCGFSIKFPAKMYTLCTSKFTHDKRTLVETKQKSFFFFPSFFLSITFSAIERSYLSLLGSVGERTRASYRFNFLFLNTYRRSFLLGCGGYLVFYEPAVSNMRNYFSRSATSATSAGREILPSITVGLPNDRELLFHRLSEFPLLKKKRKRKRKTSIDDTEEA